MTILSELVSGYKAYLEMRSLIAKPTTAPLSDAVTNETDLSLVPATTWEDLFLWSVFAEADELLMKVLWQKTRYPLRMALLASQAALRLAQDPRLRSKRASLESRAALFENWALGILESIDDKDEVCATKQDVRCGASFCSRPHLC